MNCRSCNTTIDYNFLSNCSECDTEVKPETLVPAVELFKDVPLVPQEKGVSWSRGVANVFYVLMTSLVGMVSGAVVVYFSAFLFFLLLPDQGGTPSENCARGMMLGMLSIISGAFLGTAAGSAFATKHFVIKPSRELHFPD
jgi:hypothetical protein